MENSNQVSSIVVHPGEDELLNFEFHLGRRCVAAAYGGDEL